MSRVKTKAVWCLGTLALLILTACGQMYTTPASGTMGPLRAEIAVYMDAYFNYYLKGLDIPQAIYSPGALERRAESAFAALGPRDEQFVRNAKFVNEAEILSFTALMAFLQGEHEISRDLFQRSFDTVRVGEGAFLRQVASDKRDTDLAWSLLQVGLDTAAISMPSYERAMAMRNLTNTVMEYKPDPAKPDPSLAFISAVDFPERTPRRALVGKNTLEMAAIVQVFTSRGNCTGFHVPPGGYVMTNAHCVQDAEDERVSPRDVVVFFGSTEWATSVPVAEIHFNENYHGAKKSDPAEKWLEKFQHDWAILELNINPGISTVTYTWVPDRGHGSRLDIIKDQMGPALLAGHSGDLNDGRFLSVDLGCGWSHDMQRKLLIHNCEKWRGASGAPIFVEHKGQLRLIGIHAGSMGETGVGVPFLNFSGYLYDTVVPQNGAEKPLYYQGQEELGSVSPLFAAAGLE